MKRFDPAEPTLVLAQNGWSVSILDQRQLPWRVERVELTSAAMAAQAIREMWVRGAPLIGATAAYGLCLALREDPSDASLERNLAQLAAARPTAVNLGWALQRLRASVQPHAGAARVASAYRCAAAICDEEVRSSRSIGEHGLELIRRAVKPGMAVNVLTHCNAGALATVGMGTALAPIYQAHESGIPVHVWVDETRPRNQGALLTAYELGRAGVAHTVITDNAGGLLMQRGEVDLCLVGADRVTRNGDVCNKIGTYLKALAAFDNGVPFYVAMPSSSIDWNVRGEEIPIEERSTREVTHIRGRSAEHGQIELALAPEGTSVRNPAFDVTPARLVSGYLTERGLAPDVESLRRHFPEG
jgi:methylthioribose-1-phosphate isomerase